MKKGFLLLLCLMMCLSPLPAPAEGAGLMLEAYLDDGFVTIPGLFLAADAALADGKTGSHILEDMEALAEMNDATDLLHIAMDNIASVGGEEYQRIVELKNSDYGLRDLSFYEDNVQEYDSSLEFGIYGFPDASEELTDLVKQYRKKAAHYCMQPFFWSESDIKAVFGKKFSQFKPASPRPGFACVIVPDKAECYPETSWDDGDNYEFLDTLNAAMNAMRITLEDDSPAFTGNPQLASVFLVFDIQYPFYAKYGTEGDVRGFNCTLTLTVQDASTHKSIAKFSASEKLGNTIYSWSDGISHADVPDIYSSNTFYKTFLPKVRLALQKERSAAASSRPVTVLNAGERVGALLLQVSEDLTDAWQKAICESGAGETAVDGDNVVCRLRGYDPGLDALGKYAKAEDKWAWFFSALENAAAYDLEVTLPLENGSLGSKAKTALKKAVKKAAASAEEAFGGDDFTDALKDILFPSPTAGKVKSADGFSEMTAAFRTWYSDYGSRPGLPEEAAAAAFYVQKSQTVSVGKGPHAISVACTGTSPEKLIENSLQAAMDRYAFLPSSERPFFGQEEDILSEEMLSAAISLAKKTGTKTTLTLDLDLITPYSLPDSYWEFFGDSDSVWYDTLDSLESLVEDLPEEAAVTTPKAGIVSGGKSGTEVRFKISSDAYPTYIIMRNTSTGKIAVSAFAYPKKTTTVHVPKGYYEIVWCSGPYWYGEDVLFGSLGTYNKSEEVEIKSDDYYHTFTLVGTDGGDITIYRADPDDLKP